MRIGIDGGCLANRRGFGRFARQVLGALARANSGHELITIIDRPSAESGAARVPEGCETIEVDVREAPSKAAAAGGRRALRDMLAMGKAVAKAKLDVMYFPASYSFFPVWGARRVVVTLHDTLALAHPGLVFPSWRGRVAWTIKEYAAVRWADRIVTVSEAARRDLVAWFGLAAGKVVVVGEGPDAAFRPTPAGPTSDAILGKYGVEPGSRFVLYVGGLSPHKNLPRWIEAFAAGAAADVSLVLVGDLGDVFHTHVPELRAAVARHGLEGRVTFTGFVPDEELAYLYNRAYCLVQPSLMEGFGLPPIEAMACGTPVLSSTAGSLPEVVGAAGVYFDPTDVEGMASALRGLLAEPSRRDRLARLAAERAAGYTWDASARALFACFEGLDPAGTLGTAA